MFLTGTAIEKRDLNQGLFTYHHSLSFILGITCTEMMAECEHPIPLA